MNLSEYLKTKKMSQLEFANLIGKSQGMVSHWINGRHKIKPEDAKTIEKITKGEITRHDLRPDLFDPHKSKAA